MKNVGFTLIELVIVSIVIVILVSIAVPTYMQTVERARGREAIATLQSMYAAERAYQAERRDYISLAAVDANWLVLGIDNPNNNPAQSFSYVLNRTSTAAYSATAIRRSGLATGRYMTMPETGVIDTSNWPYP